MDDFESRIMTLADFILKINVKGPHFILFILGSDEKELIDIPKLCAAIKTSPVHSMDMVLIGPSMKTFESNYVAEGLEVRVVGVRGLFHEVHGLNGNSGIAGHHPSLLSRPPNAVCIFNGGIWGYDSWLPTLSVLRTFHGTYFLVTSYTLEEADDDNDVILSTFPSTIEWLWSNQLNPFRSTDPLKRSTQPEGREYFDNFASQCFLC